MNRFSAGKGLVPADGILRAAPWRMLFDPKPSNYLLGDQYDSFIPQHQFVQRRILAGDFPLWNPHLGCGMPNLAAIQGALLFPIQLILSPVHPFYASGIAAFIKLLLTGIFTILYARCLGVSHAAALLSGLVFSLCGFMIVWLGHPHVNCAIWLPLLLYFLERQFKEPSAARALRSWAGFALAYGFMLLGGHPPTVIHLTVGIFVYFLFRLASNRGRSAMRRSGLFLCSLAAGALLAAPQIIPYLEYYRESSTIEASAAQARWSIHLSPKTLIHVLLPHASGSPAAGFEDLQVPLGLQAKDNFNERTGYVGIVPLFLALVAVACRRCRFSYFFLAAVTLSLLVVYGAPPLPMLIKMLPVLNSVNHVRLWLFAEFGLAVLAGLGLDVLSRIENRRRTAFLAAGFSIASVAGILWFSRILAPKLATLPEPARDFLLQQLVVFGCGLLALAVAAFRPVGLKPRFALAVCIGWTAFDLLWFGMGYNPAIPLERYYPQTPAIEFLQKESSLSRILGAGSTLEPNTAAVYGLDDVRGSDFITVRRYEELITGKAGDFLFYGSAPEQPVALPLLNTKFLLLPEPADLNPDQFELVYSNEIAIYRFRQCLERALVVFDHEVVPDPSVILARVRTEGFDPRRSLLLEENPDRDPVPTGTGIPGKDATVRITRYQPDEVVIEASMPKPGFLLLLDTYFPGWKASVDGRRTRIYRADYNFRAVALPPGRSTVRFVYRPDSLLIGCAMSAASLVLLCTAWFWARGSKA